MNEASFDLTQISVSVGHCSGLMTVRVPVCPSGTGKLPVPQWKAYGLLHERPWRRAVRTRRAASSGGCGPEVHG